MIDIPWGLNIDGNDDVWIGNFKGRSVVLMAGAEPKGRSANAKPGDVLHAFSGGSIQMLTDVSIDPAGMSGRPITGTFRWLRSAILRRMQPRLGAEAPASPSFTEWRPQ